MSKRHSFVKAALSQGVNLATEPTQWRDLGKLTSTCCDTHSTTQVRKFWCGEIINMAKSQRRVRPASSSRAYPSSTPPSSRSLASLTPASDHMAGCGLLWSQDSVGGPLHVPTDQVVERESIKDSSFSATDMASNIVHRASIFATTVVTSSIAGLSRFHELTDFFKIVHILSRQRVLLRDRRGLPDGPLQSHWPQH